MFALGVQPECILDGGAQVIIMRRDIWEQLRTPLVANQAMRMESANATTTLTMGLIENHLVTIGSVTVFLQIQVVEDAPFKVLLGWPFFDVTNCTEISHSGGSHQILIKDPKTGTLLGSAILPPSHVSEQNLMFPYVVLLYVFLCFWSVSTSHPDLSPLYCTSQYFTSFTSVHLSISHPSPVPPIFLSVCLDYPRTPLGLVFHPIYPCSG